MKKEEKNMIMIFGITFMILSLVGYLFNINILKFSVKTETGHVLHFVSLYISLVVSLSYYGVIKLLKKNIKDK